MITFTYAYAAPELVSGAMGRKTTATSGADGVRVVTTEFRPTRDVYPLGVMLFQALDPGLSLNATMEEYWLASKLVTTSELRAAVRKALAPDPQDRFQTVDHFAVALREALRSATE